MEHVADVARFIRRPPGWIVLPGVPPSEPRPSTGGSSRLSGSPGPVFRQGCFWNTLVFVSEVAALLAAGRACVPGLAGRLGRLSAFRDGAREAGAVRRAYALAPTVNFSRAVLEACAQPVAVSSVPDLTWCDLGSPDRVLKTLARSGIEVPWVAGATA